MKTLRLLLSISVLTISGCMTIGSFSYTAEDGQSVSIGFQQREKPVKGFQK